MLKKSPYTPAHLYLDNAPYFITSAIHRKRPLLADAAVKRHLLATLQACFLEKGWQLNDWVILDNHYHLLGVSAEGRDLSTIFRKIHTLSGSFIRQHCLCNGPVWWNYWDYCPRNESDYMTRLNYLLINPVKHGYCDNLYAYPFSSFHGRIETSGREALNRQFKTYPDYRSLQLDEDDF
jgi:putative transposase